MLVMPLDSTRVVVTVSVAKPILGQSLMTTVTGSMMMMVSLLTFPISLLYLQLGQSLNLQSGALALDMSLTSTSTPTDPRLVATARCFEPKFGSET